MSQALDESNTRWIAYRSLYLCSDYLYRFLSNRFLILHNTDAQLPEKIGFRFSQILGFKSVIILHH